MIDRSKPPEFKIIKNISLPKIKHFSFEKNINFNLIPNSIDQVISLFINFRGGAWVQDKPFVADTTVNMFKQGTKTKSSKEIVNILNFFAVKYKAYSTNHYCHINLTLLKKYLKQTLDLLSEMLLQPAFVENELSIYLNNNKQSYLIELQEVETQAQNIFYKNIYGSSHPYGIYGLPEDYDKITRSDIINYHKKVFVKENIYLTGAGNFNEKDISLLKNFLAKLKQGNRINFEYNPIKPSDKKFIYEQRPDSLQSAIFIGNQTIHYTHPDYMKLLFVIFALGGYFGSRLMANIREEKGLTYSIYSYINTSLKASNIVIEASVKKEKKEQVIEEIRKEIQKLKNKGLSENELNISKNLLMAKIFKLTDGTYSFAKFLNSLYAKDLDHTYIINLANTIQKIDNKTILDISNKYLCFENFYKIVVG